MTRKYQPRTAQPKHRLNVRIDRALVNGLQDEAQRRGTTLTALLAEGARLMMGGNRHEGSA